MEELEMEQTKKEYMREYMRKYYILNKQRCLELMRNYQQTHLEEQREYRRKYYQEYRKRKKLEIDGKQQDCNNNI